MNLAYEELPAYHRARMMLDTFSSTLGNAYLQQHLLAINADTLEAAVRAGSEFLQIRASFNRRSATQSGMWKKKETPPPR